MDRMPCIESWQRCKKAELQKAFVTCIVHKEIYEPRDSLLKFAGMGAGMRRADLLCSLLLNIDSLIA